MTTAPCGHIHGGGGGGGVGKNKIDFKSLQKKSGLGLGGG